MHRILASAAVIISLAIVTSRAFAQEMPASTLVPVAENGTYNLSNFGSILTAAEAQSALLKAIDTIIARGGGLLIVPPEAPADWKFENTAPSSTKPNVASITIVDRRFGYEKVLPPSNGTLTASSYWAGRYTERDVRATIDRPFGVHATDVINTNIAGGTASYILPILFDVKKGNDQKVYPVTVRGLFEGMTINVTGTALGYGNPNELVVIKSIGWDKEKRLPYIVLDLQHDHPKDALLTNKHVVNSLSIIENSNSDNQSMALHVVRHLYGQGDSFGVSSSLRTQSNIMSAGGDEGALTFAADIYSDVNPFHSTVEKISWNTNELVYGPGAVNNHTLGTSRPLINLNQQKWVTNGTVRIVAPGHQDPWDPADSRRTGKELVKEVFGGGAIIGSKDCGWTNEVVGRFFAVNESSEYLDPANDSAAGYAAAPERRTYRWYLIQKLESRADGTKRLFVERTRWWSRDDQAPNLYDFENYTWSGHERALKYIIAPGSYVNDISRAWTNAENMGGIVEASSPRTLKLAPNGDVGTRFDFAPGDPIVQAIGQDPWNPTGLRVRHHNYLPSTIEDSSFQSVNNGRVTVNSAINIGGGSTNITTDVASSKDKKPRFMRGVDITATAGVGVDFRADVEEAAIQFQQPNNRPQAMKWNVNGIPTHSLSVDPKQGGFTFQGNGLKLPLGGISAGEKNAANLRGIAVPVAANAKNLNVRFPRPEPDANYAINVQPSWLTQDAVMMKTANGFTVMFSAPPTKASQLDWVLIR